MWPSSGDARFDMQKLLTIIGTAEGSWYVSPVSCGDPLGHLVGPLMTIYSCSQEPYHLIHVLEEL